MERFDLDDEQLDHGRLHRVSVGELVGRTIDPASDAVTARFRDHGLADDRGVLAAAFDDGVP